MKSVREALRSVESWGERIVWTDAEVDKLIEVLKASGYAQVSEDPPEAFINLVETKWTSLSAYDMTRLYQDMLASQDQGRE
jgi:hypothetical protein